MLDMNWVDIMWRVFPDLHDQRDFLFNIANHLMCRIDDDLAEQAIRHAVADAGKTEEVFEIRFSGFDNIPDNSKGVTKC